jgi:hypothetical protein
VKTIIAIAVVCCVVTACNVGVKKDLISGLSVSNNGFSYDEAMLVDNENQPTKSNEVELNKTIAIVVTGIRNFTEKDGLVFPNLSMVVVDKADTVVLEGSDILSEQNGFSPADASTLSGTITAGSPMKAGESYHALMTIVDKLNPENRIEVNVDIVVK